MNRRDPLPNRAKEFLAYCDTIHKESTVCGYVTNLNTFHSFLRRKFKITNDVFEKIERHHMEEWFYYLLDCRLANATRRLHLNNVRCYFNWAIERGYLKKEVTELIKRKDFPKIPEYLPKPLEIDHDKKLIQYLRTTDVLGLRGLLILRYTGMRVGELLKMPYHCLYKQQDGRYAIKVPLGKLNNERLIPLTDEITKLVQSIQAESLETQYVSKKESCDGCHRTHYQKIPVQHNPEHIKFLMTSKNGRVVSYSGMRSAINRACNQAGIPHYSIHQLRHTFATRLIEAGTPLPVVQYLLGHRDITMTMRYTQITQELVRKEFFKANQLTEKEFEIYPSYWSEGKKFNIADSFEDIIHFLEKLKTETADPALERQYYNFLKKMKRHQKKFITLVQ